MNSDSKVKIFIRNSNDGFSIERIFAKLFGYSNNKYFVFKVFFKSYGILSRIFLIIECFFKSSKINHITGDIYYVIPFLRGKKIITIHDLGMLYELKGIKRKLYKFFWFDFPLKYSDTITTVSNYSKKEILENLKVKPDKIKVIYNPIVLDSNKVKTSLKIKNQPKILFIGTKANKNMINLIKAVSGLGIKLLIVGILSSKQKSFLKLNHIIYENFINLNDNNMIDLYISSDILAFPSFYEGFGMPIIEANLFGLPVLTSNLSCMPEIAGDSAIFVNPHDIESIRNGVVNLINNEVLRLDMQKKGFKNCLRFSKDKIKKDYINIYNSIL